ncbi:MAG TPA: hypothetical protein VE954_00715 [Oligoflexus sp.]|uniref:hypothetical protein n=1 Tax=Oligoflexus sp. TaxID=1971216 RepID=UPI002D330223|nr:hypothetical protein [Oligoflexus sp.]HYX31601.1 hypothetical protein [Oligoflexus sp.]
MNYAKLVPAVVSLSFAGCGGGGGGSNDPGVSPPADSPIGNQQTTDETSYYQDVRDVKSLKPLKAGQWPSFLKAGDTLNACSEGQIFHADRCWDSVTINLDNASVKLVDQDSEFTLALGSKLPVQIAGWIDEKYDSPTHDCHLPYNVDLNGGYVDFATIRCRTPGNIPESYAPAPVVWPGLSPLDVSSNYPWVIAPSIFTEKGTDDVKGFGVKTTFLYGHYATRDDVYSVAHNWQFRGAVIVNGKTLPLPVTMEALALEPGFEEWGTNSEIARKTGKSLIIISYDKGIDFTRREMGNSLHLSPANQRYVSDIRFSANNEDRTDD